MLLKYTNPEWIVDDSKEIEQSVTGCFLVNEVVNLQSRLVADFTYRNQIN